MEEVTVDELKTLMTLRKNEAKEMIKKKYSGIENLCKRLNSDQQNGISANEEGYKKRREKYGANEIPLPPIKPFIMLIRDALQDLTLMILFTCAIISLGLSFYDSPAEVNGNSSNKEHGWIQCAAILISVAVIVFVTALNDWIKERQFRDFQAKIKIEQKFSVIRDGQQIQIPVTKLVVGDVAQIKYGDVLPADGIIVQSNELRIDESSLTGESDLNRKSLEIDPMLFSGTFVMEGSGRMLVTAVGVNSQAGVITTLLGGYTKDEKNKKSVLEAKLTNLAIQIGYFGSVVAISIIIILVFQYCLTNYLIQENAFKWSDLKYFIHFLIIGVTVLVVAVPEGLPLAVTLSLAYSVKKMMKDKILVRHIGACETMGNLTSICIDKTGTLTTNQMTVVQSYIAGVYYKTNEPVDFDSIHPVHAQRIIEAISINSSFASHTFLPKSSGQQVEQYGNKIDCALLGFVLSLGQSYQAIRDGNPESSFFEVYTFNSYRKYMATVIENSHTGGYRVFVKGASEIMLSRCKWIVGSNNTIVPFEAKDRNTMIQDVIEPMASDGLRTICIAFKDYVPEKRTNPNDIQYSGNIHWEDERAILNDLTCLIVVGIQDPVRPEVPDAIRKCQEAGITVRMVTGDNINTARAIATACDIFKPEEDFIALESKLFNEQIRDENGEFSQAKFDAILPKLRILASALPSDKYVLVKGIIDSKNEVVAVTGRGTYDGVVLKKADVGFAMGIAGTDIAKEASDIILVNDNFSSIVKAIMWGRNVYDSIAKFLQFQLTVNIVAVVVTFVGACVIQDTILKPVQMLWINLIMDTLASLALATELPTEDLLKRKPYGRTSPLVSERMLKNLFGHAVYQLAVLFTLIFAGEKIFGIECDRWADIGAPAGQHFTIVFNTFVLMTLFNEFNARKIHGERNVFQGLFSNPIFYSLFIISFILQVTIVQFGGEWFSTQRLECYQWLACLGFGLGTLLWGQLIASIPVSDFSESLNIDSEEVKFTGDILNGNEYKDDKNNEKGPGRILWIRGLTRLKTQLDVVRAFQEFPYNYQNYKKNI